MEEFASKTSPAGRWRFRLWHLSVAVLVAALIFGLLRAAMGQEVWPHFVVLFFFLVGLGIFFSILVIGLRVANHFSLSLLELSKRRGWPVGFVLMGSALLLYIAIGLIATVLGFFVAAAWIGLLYYVVGD